MTTIAELLIKKDDHCYRRIESPDLRFLKPIELIESMISQTNMPPNSATGNGWKWCCNVMMGGATLYGQGGSNSIFAIRKDLMSQHYDQNIFNSGFAGACGVYTLQHHRAGWIKNYNYLVVSLPAQSIFYENDKDESDQRQFYFYQGSCNGDGLVRLMQFGSNNLGWTEVVSYYPETDERLVDFGSNRMPLYLKFNLLLKQMQNNMNGNNYFPSFLFNFDMFMPRSQRYSENNDLYDLTFLT